MKNLLFCICLLMHPVLALAIEVSVSTPANFEVYVAPRAQVWLDLVGFRNHSGIEGATIHAIRIDYRPGIKLTHHYLNHINMTAVPSQNKFRMTTLNPREAGAQFVIENEGSYEQRVRGYITLSTGSRGTRDLGMLNASSQDVQRQAVAASSHTEHGTHHIAHGLRTFTISGQTVRQNAQTTINIATALEQLIQDMLAVEIANATTEKLVTFRQRYRSLVDRVEASVSLRDKESQRSQLQLITELLQNLEQTLAENAGSVDKDDSVCTTQSVSPYLSHPALLDDKGELFKDPVIIAESASRHNGRTFDMSKVPSRRPPLKHYPNRVLKDIIEYFQEKPNATYQDLVQANIIQDGLTLDTFDAPYCMPTGQSISKDSMDQCVRHSRVPDTFDNPYNRYQHKKSECVYNVNLQAFLTEPEKRK